MPRRKPRTTRASSSANNAVEKFKPKTIDGCNTCPPKKSCEGPEVTFETSGCLNGGGSINLRQVQDQVIPMHVECPGNGKLTVTTCESINGGGEFTANQKCGTDIELCINNSWLDRFVNARIGDGELVIGTDDSISSIATNDGKFTANQFDDTSIIFGVDWSKFPVCDLSLVYVGSCWVVNWSQFPACASGGIVWQDGCWKLDLSGQEISWDQIVGKPDCFPACEEDPEPTPEPTEPPETPEPTDPPETPEPTDPPETPEPTDPPEPECTKDKDCDDGKCCSDDGKCGKKYCPEAEVDCQKNSDCPSGECCSEDGECGEKYCDPCKDHVASNKKCENNKDCPECEECVEVKSFVSSVFRTTPSSLSYDMRHNRERIEDLEEQVRNLTAQLAKLMA